MKTNLQFDFGRLVITAHAKDVLEMRSVNRIFGERYLQCDWGNLCESDWKQNDEALQNGDRIFAAYKDRNDTKFWIITEHDRSYTTILLPSDY